MIIHNYLGKWLRVFQFSLKEMKWSKCWGNAIIGKGLEHGEVHGPLVFRGFPSKKMEHGEK